MKKLITIIFIIIFACFGIILGVVFNNIKDTFYKESKEKNVLHENIDSKNYDTFGVIIKDKKNANVNQLILNQKDNLFDYNIEFILPEISDDEIFLTIYLDYEQIPFCVNNSSKYNIFHKLKGNQKINLPVSFKVNSADIGMHMVNLVITTHPNLNIYDNKKNILNESYIMMTRHGLVIDNKKGALDKKYSINKFNTTKLENYMNISLNAEKVKDSISIQKDFIKAKSNQIIDIPIIAGGYNKDNEYLIWMSLDWKQTNINNKKFYYFKTLSNTVAELKVSLKTPSKPGKYELCSYMSTNPWSMDIKKCMAIESSNRITLIVE